MCTIIGSLTFTQGQGFTLLHAMASQMDFKMHLDFVEECFKQCKHHINAKTKDGDTPLHLAIRFSYYSNVKYLLEHGADANVTNVKKQTPFHTAAALKYDEGLEIVKIVMEHTMDINAKDQNDFTPIMYAVRYRLGDNYNVHIDIINYLIEKGVDTEHSTGSGDYEDSLMTLLQFYNKQKDIYGPIIKKLKENQDDKLMELEWNREEEI